MSESGEETEGEIEQEFHVIHHSKIERKRMDCCEDEDLRTKVWAEHRNV